MLIGCLQNYLHAKFQDLKEKEKHCEIQRGDGDKRHKKRKERLIVNAYTGQRSQGSDICRRGKSKMTQRCWF